MSYLFINVKVLNETFCVRHNVPKKEKQLKQQYYHGIKYLSNRFRFVQRSFNNIHDIDLENINQYITNYSQKCQLPIYLSIRFKCIKDPVWKPNKVGFFAKGREFESVTTNHQYTEIELAKMATFESLDYLPPWSEPYKKWLREMPRRLDWD